MKIFNWVHRRFHNGAPKDGLARSVEKDEFIKYGADKQALLKQVALVDVLDGWKDGILTIGTLGLDPLIKPFNLQQNKYYSVLETEDEDSEKQELDQAEQEPISDDDNAEDEEVNPLLFTTFKHNFNDFESKWNDSDMTTMTVDDDDHYNVNPTPNKTYSCDRTLPGFDQGRRTTLAELFKADSDMKKKDSLGFSGKTDKTNCTTKNGMSKLNPHVGEDKHKRPMKKIHQLMRRMLKRKIHPELEGKGLKADNLQNKSGLMEVDMMNKEKAAESVFLLLTPPGSVI